MRNTLKHVLVFLLVCSLLVSLVGCAGGEGPAEEPSEEGVEEPVEAPDEPLKVAFVMSNTVENIYNRAMMLALNNLLDEGYSYELSYSEEVSSDNAESVLRAYAEGGYDVIICHAGITRDPVAKIYTEYPDTVFLGGGYERDTMGLNVGAYDQTLQEGCFVLGAIAAMMTETDVVGCIGGFEQANVTSLFNSFELGAKYVNPNITVIVSYLESWYDPVKAKENANTQISMGADIILAERDGVIQACQEAGVYAMAEKVDQIHIAPDTVLGCSVIRWDNVLLEVFDRVKEGSFEARYYTPYEGAMAVGMNDLVLNEELITADILDEAKSIADDISTGEIEVPFMP